MNLVEANEAFYYKDFSKDDRTYRIFNYRLASYTNFLEDGALECRGIMYDVTDWEPVLVSRPMEKFFNLNENPLTMNLDLTRVVDVELKADGSLISTYLHNDELFLKTKGSIESDQAIAAMKYLDAHPEFKEELTIIALLDNTVNMEWCAPDNRIVIGYLEPQLTVLNIRSNKTGDYIDRDIVLAHADPVLKETASRWIDKIDFQQVGALDFVDSIPSMEDVEGYIVLFESGQRVKIKTEWYLVQHRAKDSINSPRRLFEAVLEEATDDLRSLFYDDPLVIQLIEEMELKVDGIYNHVVDQVERFFERNKEIDRKDYALLGQKELDRKIFGLAMTKYLVFHGLSKVDVDYKAFMKKHYRDFGITDEEVGDE